ncbi:CoA-binding protein [Chamaesiphon sp. GL140_3_metabinner_50]|uniref:succinate--CoA ligase subunit alpha n=1 Tax=Chamaesiphon sp. GL140_3_metabinner_50 TaxID=2970812 RepID=UPI0025DDE6FF|nr:CoA-binding protein [Chamaesiphon sp. GL140_3_metabinner_50]
MTIDLQLDSRVLIQGVDNPLALAAIGRMQTYGTKIVGIVSAGQGGGTLGDLPMFDLVEEAQLMLGPIETSLIFVSAYQVLDAALEAIAAGIPQIIIITRGLPPLDMIRLLRQASISKTLILGSGSAGIIIPDRLLLGIYQPQLFSPGKVAIISRNQSLTAEIASELNQANLGQSIVIHIGSDPLVGSSCRLWLEWLQSDPFTESIVLVGDICWDSEAATAAYLLAQQGKPVVAYLAGIHASTPHPLTDAAIVLSHTLSKPIHNADTIQQRIETYKRAKIPVAKKIGQIPSLLKKLGSKG